MLQCETTSPSLLPRGQNHKSPESEQLLSRAGLAGPWLQSSVPCSTQEPPPNTGVPKRAAAATSHHPCCSHSSETAIPAVPALSTETGHQRGMQIEIYSLENKGKAVLEEMRLREHQYIRGCLEEGAPRAETLLKRIQSWGGCSAQPKERRQIGLKN